MSIPNRKKELVDTILKKEIITTVLSLINDGKPVTMDEVAKASGVAKGTLYNYFKNREEMLSQVHQAVLDPISSSIRGIFNSDMPAMEKIHTYIETVINVHDNVCVYFKFLQQEKTVEQDLIEKYVLVVEPLAKVCRQGMDEGTIIRVNPFMMAEMIFGAVVGYFKTSVANGLEKPEMNEIKRDMICLIDRIVTA